MTNDKAPAHYIVAQPVSATIRQAYEECDDQLYNAPGVRSLELDPVVLPSGEIATVRCGRDRKGELRNYHLVCQAGDEVMDWEACMARHEASGACLRPRGQSCAVCEDLNLAIVPREGKDELDDYWLDFA